MARTVYYAAVSADGFIADSHGGVGWLGPFNSADLGYEAFFKNVGAVVLGRTTYEQALTFGPWPYAGRAGLVLTARALTGLPKDVRTVTPNHLRSGVERLREQNDGDVWVVGGGKTARACLDVGLLDELELYVIPHVLGAGIPLLAQGETSSPLHLMESRGFPNGVVMVRYAVPNMRT